MCTYKGLTPGLRLFTVFWGGITGKLNVNHYHACSADDSYVVVFGDHLKTVKIGVESEATKHVAELSKLGNCYLLKKNCIMLYSSLIFKVFKDRDLKFCVKLASIYVFIQVFSVTNGSWAISWQNFDHFVPNVLNFLAPGFGTFGTNLCDPKKSMKKSLQRMKDVL